MSQMVTTCPNCRQQLAVTAADLRVGQGFVRCGRCDKVFNALLTLTEDAPAPSEPESVAHGTSSMPALDEQEVLPPLPGREKDEDAPFDLDDEVEVVQTHVTGQFRSLVLEGDRVNPDELVELETGSEPAGDDAVGGEVAADEVDRLDLELAEDDAAGPAAAPDLDLSIAPDRDEVAREIIRQATSQPIDILLGEEHEERPAPARPAVVAAPPPPPPQPEPFDADDMLGTPPRPARLWYVAAVLLALVLAGQYANLNRQRLVAVPWLERPIQAIYGLFGTSVEPAWDLAQYEISRLGEMEPAGGGAIVQRAAVAVKKDARRAQPPPLLRAVLSDRFGNELATHDIAPGNWLLDPAQAQARLEPGERLDAQLSLPGNERATGIALYACLPDAGGTAHCADQILR